MANKWAVVSACTDGDASVSMELHGICDTFAEATEVAESAIVKEFGADIISHPSRVEWFHEQSQTTFRILAD